MTQISAFTTGLFAGMPGRVDIEIAVERETRVQYIEASVTAHEGWTVGAGKSSISNGMRTPLFQARLAGPGVLPVGVTRIPIALTIPPYIPPSHDIAPAHAYVEIKLHVAIPWRLDDRARYRLPVRIPSRPPMERHPSATRSPIAGENDPRIELGIADARIAAGDQLIGSVAVFHMDDRKPREVSILLDPILDLYGRGRPREHHGTALGTTIVIPAGSGGASVPFSIRVPTQTAPSFQGASHALRWQVVARTGSFLRGKVAVTQPIVLVDASGVDTTRRPAIAPGLTDDRVAGVFANFARTNGYHPADDEHDGALAIARTAASAAPGSELQLAYAHRGEAGTFLVGRVAHPSLGLGLEVAPSSVLRHVFFRDVEVGVPDWDRAHLVQARSEAQAQPVLRAAVPALHTPEVATTLGGLASWTDHAIAFERLVVAVDARDLAQASAALEHVAAAIAAASALAEPPAGLAVDRDAWGELARSLAGHLALADLSIVGTRGAAPVNLGLAFDAEGRPLSLHAAAGNPEHAGELARAIQLRLAHPAAEIAASDAPGAVRELVAQWPPHVVDLQLANGVATASFPIADRADAADARALVESLVALLGALAPDGGPYR